MGIVRIVRVAVEHGQGDFGELDRHAEDAHDPHPENGTGTTERDRERDAPDIAQADGGGERGGKCLEMIDGSGIVGIVVAAAKYQDAVSQRPVLAEAAPDREDHSCTKQDDQNSVVPDNAVQRR